jgi:hypothetical protein
MVHWFNHILALLQEHTPIETIWKQSHMSKVHQHCWNLGHLAFGAHYQILKLT